MTNKSAHNYYHTDFKGESGSDTPPIIQSRSRKRYAEILAPLSIMQQQPAFAPTFSDFSPKFWLGSVYVFTKAGTEFKALPHGPLGCNLTKSKTSHCRTGRSLFSKECFSLVLHSWSFSVRDLALWGRQLSPGLWIWTAVPISTLHVNVTYCLFKVLLQRLIRIQLDVRFCTMKFKSGTSENGEHFFKEK